MWVGRNVGGTSLSGQGRADPARRWVVARSGGNETSDDDNRFYAEDNIPPNVADRDWRVFRARLVAHEKEMELKNQKLDWRGQTYLLNGLESLRSVNNEGGMNIGKLYSLGSGDMRWCHTISHPERGCLLVARRANLGMFSYSVILITEHDDAVGSSGLVLNMPTPLRIANLGLEEGISSAFGPRPLYIGGPVTRNLLHILHGCPNVEGAMDIVHGIYAGGVESASELVNSGKADPAEFRLLAGYSGWEPYQLAGEIQEGAWHVISASSDIILGCIKGDLSVFAYEHADQEIGISGTDDKKLHFWRAILAETGLEIEI